MMYYIGDEEIEALKKLFEKKQLFRYHAQFETECDQFEKEFSKVFGTNYSLILSSGTNSILLALLAGGVQPGDEVLLPAYTFVATAAAVIQAGAIPILVDVDENLSMKVNEARKKITPKTKAVILVHMDGLVADVMATKKLCAELDLVFIEDVAQAIGGSFQGKMLGTFGDFGCFSLNENKIISCGEGGILITPKRAFYEKALCLHDTPLQFSPSKKGLFKEIVPCLGFSMRVSEIQGAIMRVQLKRMKTILQELRIRKNYLIQEIINNENVKVVRGFSEEGDCATTLHLQFKSPEQAIAAVMKFKEARILLSPVTARPAHASWKWSQMFNEKAHIQEARNPFLKTEKKYEYKNSDQIESIDILTRTLRMEIDIHLSPEKTKELGKKINICLASIV